MKARSLFSVASLFLLVALMLQATPVTAAPPFPKAEGLDVMNLASDPYAYKGDITVRGGVMSAEPAKKMFHIVDYREYRACRSVDCAPAWVSVLYNGKLPERTNVVEVTGSIEKNPAGKGGYVLRAKAVRVK